MSDVKTRKKTSPITVKKIASTDKDPITLASHAARTCYSATVPEMGDIMNVEDPHRAGHNTIFEHNYYTFHIDGIPVSSVIFGLHLTAPFYNSSQRSGRYSKMYENPDMNEIENTIYAYYPELWASDVNRITDFIKFGLDVYHHSKPRIDELARDAIKAERPHASDKYINQYAPKFAQEQLRMFISMIAPTALDYTIDLSAIGSFYRGACTRPMRDVIGQMVELAEKDQKNRRNRDPKNANKNTSDISYMFKDSARRTEDWSPEFPGYKGVKTTPECKLIDYEYDDANFKEIKPCDMYDIWPYTPETMDNRMMYVRSRVHVDVGATYGQDQRHRSIDRSEPKFTGYFYLPPLLDAANLKPAADEFMQRYDELYKDPKFAKSLMTMIAPYGLMVQYVKRANLNALIHEQGKRTCWCAQEAIYHISCDLREQLAEKIGPDAKLLKYITPPCLSMGKCPEGSRCCGRSIADAMREVYFQKRRV